MLANQSVADMLSPLIASVTDIELAFIAALDYGQEVQQHLEALRAVIFDQDGTPQDGQVWHPYEVIELGAHAIHPGHEREFAICTLLVIQSVMTGFDSSTNLSAKLDHRSRDYDLLPTALRDEVLRAYQVAGC